MGISFIILALSFASVVTWISIPKYIRENQCNNRNEIKGGYTKDIKLISRELRHDYMNAFQIIYGYLQLKKSEKAVEYIKKFNALTVNISKVYNLSITSIAIFLDKIIRESNSKGINIYYDVKAYTDDEYRGAKNEYDIILSLSELFNLIIEEISHLVSKEDLIVDIMEFKDRIEFMFKGNNEELIQLNLESKFPFIKIHEEKIIATFYYLEPEAFEPYETIFSKTLHNI